ncbi:hypothetical protein Tco_0985744, partial [Tanacetum coccineum]
MFAASQTRVSSFTFGPSVPKSEVKKNVEDVQGKDDYPCDSKSRRKVLLLSCLASKSPGSAGASYAQGQGHAEYAGLDDVVGDNRSVECAYRGKISTSSLLYKLIQLPRNGSSSGLTASRVELQLQHPVRYDATENQLSTDTSLQRRILKRRYYLVVKAKDTAIVGLLVRTLGVAEVEEDTPLTVDYLISKHAKFMSEMSRLQ